MFLLYQRTTQSKRAGIHIQFTFVIIVLPYIDVVGHFLIVNHLSLYLVGDDRTTNAMADPVLVRKMVQFDHDGVQQFVPPASDYRRCYSAFISGSCLCSGLRPLH